MKVWILEISDFLPEIDGINRPYRAGMLANALIKEGHHVQWWTSTFNHQLRRQRFDNDKTLRIEKNLVIKMLHGPGYKRSISYSRWKHNKTVAARFKAELINLTEKERPDIIYSCLPTLELCEEAIKYGKNARIPVVVDIRDQWPDIYLTLVPKIFRKAVDIF